MDTIFIEGLQADALIGVHDWERRGPQRLRIDLELAADLRRAGASDRLAHTVDYAEVADAVVGACGQSRYQLVEALAEHIAHGLLERFPISALTLRITKPGVVPAARAVGVQIHRSRAAA